ncbi:MAG: dinitrogenase iron-molybdenum cofactor biosynthesis protein [Candidatus Aegiribacteria sp.]|nr:dinitrogenase iron-molybdenum cofactor biosynthesis protein [Candidatus Aegiribacteria sp.]
MKIVVSSDSNRKLDSSVSHHFGRCPYFTIVDLEENEIINVESVENPYFNGHSPGQVPSFIKELDADVMLAGGMGRRAISIFENYGISCSTGAAGTVRNAVNNYAAGSLSAASPCRESIEHAHDGYEHKPVERLREEAAALLAKLDEVIVKLPDRKKE